MSMDSNEMDGARSIKASEFKVKCLKLLDEVADSGEEIVITKDGKPVAKLTPYRNKSSLWFGRDRDLIEIHGDIVSRMPAEWFTSPSESAYDQDPDVAPCLRMVC